MPEGVTEIMVRRLLGPKGKKMTEGWKNYRT
jgi:hypothetical protein